MMLLLMGIFVINLMKLCFKGGFLCCSHYLKPGGWATHEWWCGQAKANGRNTRHTTACCNHSNNSCATPLVSGFKNRLTRQRQTEFGSYFVRLAPTWPPVCSLSLSRSEWRKQIATHTTCTMVWTAYMTQWGNADHQSCQNCFAVFVPSHSLNS